jgi:hypothetical protein
MVQTGRVVRSVLRRVAQILVMVSISAGVVGAMAVPSPADEPPTPGLSATFTLKRHSVVAGGTVKGTVTVHNDTGAPVSAMG